MLFCGAIILKYLNTVVQPSHDPVPSHDLCDGSTIARLISGYHNGLCHNRLSGYHNGLCKYQGSSAPLKNVCPGQKRMNPCGNYNGSVPTCPCLREPC